MKKQYKNIATIYRKMEVKKTADKKAYMREYKRKQYALKSDDMKERNRAYYAASKYGNNEDLKKYDKKCCPLCYEFEKSWIN